MDSTAALELPDIPDRLLVIGGGYIGLELGTVYAALGSRSRSSRCPTACCPASIAISSSRWPAAASKLFKRHPSRDAREPRCARPAAPIEAQLRRRDGRAFDRVLVAVGRRPQTDGPRARADPRAARTARLHRVDERCRTADPHVFAVGDVTGEPMLAHRAMRQGKVAAEASPAGRPRSTTSRSPPSSSRIPRSPGAGSPRREAKRPGGP